MRLPILRKYLVPILVVFGILSAPITYAAVQKIYIGAIGSNSDAALVWDSTNHRLSINSSTPGSTVVVQGSSTAPTIPIFTVASSSNAILLQVASNGLVTVENDLTVNGALTLGSALSVSNGGTGVTGFTAGEVLFGNGSTDITSSGSLFWDDGNTRLGIGTSTPQQTLVVIGSTTITSLGAGCVNSTALGGLFVASCGSGGSGNSAWTIGNALIYNATSTDSVLIGTSTPTASTLEVQGTSGKMPVRVTSSTGISLFEIEQDGKVGIGTSTPLALLSLGNGIGGAPTTSAQGINFGDAAANLYRSGASTLQTDAASFIFNGGSGIIRGTSMTVQGGGGGGGNYQVTLSANAAQTFTSGTAGIARSNGTFQPASGSGVWNGFDIQGTINQCAACTGISRGLFVNPTAVTRAADYRALEVAAYTYNTAGTALTTAYGSLFNAYTLASTTSKTIANASTLAVAGAPIAGTFALITSSTALSITTSAVTSSTTNAQGLWVEAPTGATNNYAALFMGGKVGIGTSGPGSLLSLSGTSGSTAPLFTVASSSGAKLLEVQNSTYGQLLIGTTTPTSNFFIQGNSVAATVNLFEVASSTGTTLFVIKNTGNVGINTTTPATNVHITGTAATIRIGEATSNKVGCIEMYDSTATTTLTYLYVAGGALTVTGTKPAFCQ